MKITRKISILVLSLTMLIGSLAIPASAAERTMYGIGFVNASSLRLRSEASTNASIAATATRGECVVVISKSGDWYKVSYNLQEGYMHKAYLDVATKENAELGYGQITGNGVNLRSGPATTYSVTAVSAKNDKCYIIGLNEGWYKVLYKDSVCYIRSDFVTLTEIPYENAASSNAPKYFRHGEAIGNALNSEASSPAAAPSVNGSDILAEAKMHLGTRYLSGGASPSGFDCAGLVYYVLKQVGYSPFRTPASQYQMGTYVEKSSLQPGDIVFFSDTGTSGISHVGIYAGGGQFIHAPNSRTTVSYSDLTNGYWANHYYGARRIG